MSDSDQINEPLTQALAETPAAPLDKRTRDRMLGRLKARLQAPAPAGTQTIPLAVDGWEPFDDGVARQLLVADHGDGTETAVYRLDPGARFGAHAHTAQETCWVIEGEILVGDTHPVTAGQLHIADPGCEHPEIVARTPALLLIRSQVYVGALTPP